MPTKNESEKQGNRVKGNSERGFGDMDPERQREIASEGGKASHGKGTGNDFNAEETRETQRKGGESSLNSDR